jgi:hypothetical protein
VKEYPILREPGCACTGTETEKLAGTYIDGPVTSAIFDLRAWKSLAAWQHEVCRSRGGGWGYQLRRAARSKVQVARFHPKNWVADWTEIDFSAPKRQGRDMAWNYRRTLEERGGEPTEWLELSDLPCTQHWRMCMGAFAPAEKRTIGGHEVEQKLVAYTSLIRSDNLLVVSMLLGHSEWLKQGVVPLLFHSLVGMLLVPDEKRPPTTRGIRYILYGGWGDGREGLRNWKQVAKFEAGRLVKV